VIDDYAPEEGVCRNCRRLVMRCHRGCPWRHPQLDRLPEVSCGTVADPEFGSVRRMTVPATAARDAPAHGGQG
jgi:hypothetical protein